MSSTTNLSSRMNGMNSSYSTEIKSKYLKYGLRSFFIGVFIGYMCYYIVRLITSFYPLPIWQKFQALLRRKLVY